MNRRVDDTAIVAATSIIIVISIVFFILITKIGPVKPCGDFAPCLVYDVHVKV